MIFRGEVVLTVRRRFRLEAPDEAAAAKLALRGLPDETVETEPAPRLLVIWTISHDDDAEGRTQPYLPVCWAATVDPPRQFPGLARWLDNQVAEAVADYITAGTLFLNAETLQFEFAAAEGLDHETKKFDFADVVDWVELNVRRDGKVDPEDDKAVAVGRRLRDRLMQAVDELDAALPVDARRAEQ